MKVFVCRKIPAAGLDKITAACEADIWEGDLPPTQDQLAQRVRGVDGIVSLVTDKIDGDIMDTAGKQLKIISQMAVGVDNIDIQAAKARGIKVGNTPGVLTDATADLAFALLLALTRRIVEGVDYVRAGRWKTWGPELLLGPDLRGATLGIIGLGRIGKAVARRAFGFEMRILAHSIDLTPDEAAEVHAQTVDLESLLHESDFVTIHTPYTPETHHLMNRERLQMMKPTGLLINTARGPIVDQKALIEALQNKIIGGAALDVTDPEPIPMNDPLLTMPNVIVVPHIGSASIQTRNRMAEMAAENLIAGLRGEKLPNPVTE
ncbi:MAG: D-glycerate dehydrogenase [Anaerolineae bacterium]|nr:MAG: D-glycerate dehydrogenase [Anaerolineae bacterium]